jgi:hypothetical protein
VAQRIIIHLGAHRCGSTMVQYVLNLNRRWLAEKSVAVLTRRDIVNSYGLGALAHLYKSPLGVIPAGIALRRITFPTVVLSEENILGRMPGLDGRAPYNRSGVALVAIALLARFFDCSLRWIIRRQDRLVESAYAFRVTRGGTDDFESFSGRFDRNLFWSPIAKTLERRHADCRIAFFEGLLPGSNVQRILEFLGLPIDTVPSNQLGARNARANWAQGCSLNVILSINRQLPDLDRGERLKVSSSLQKFSRELPPLRDLEIAVETSGVAIQKHILRQAHQFAADTPLPEYTAAARRSLVEHYRDDHFALMELPSVDPYGADWREP